MMTDGVFEILEWLVAHVLLVIDIDIEYTYLHKLNAVGNHLPCWLFGASDEFQSRYGFDTELHFACQALRNYNNVTISVLF